MKKQVLTLIAFCISILGFSQTFTVDFITYQVISTTTNTVKTVDYNTAGGTSVVIPSAVINPNTSISYTVTEIGSTSFNQDNLTSVIIPTSVTIIGNFAFTNNTSLSNAPLHNGITSIGQYAFNNCALTSVTIPTSMSVIEQWSFNTNNISSLIIPSNITSIGSNAFSYNLNLMNVQLHNGITSIGQSAFSNCALTTISIPTGISSINAFTFAFNNITSVVIPNNVTSIGNSAFTANDLTNLTLSNSITTIGSQAFISNQLTTVIIPESVTSIGSGAFLSNPLTAVFSEAIVPPSITTDPVGQFGQDTFAQNRGTIHLHIPPGTTGAYVTNAGALWTGFASTTEDALSNISFELENEVKVISAENALIIDAGSELQLENYIIYNLSGQEIAKGVENEIPTISYSKGVYILVLQFDKGSLSRKILIQ